MSGIESIRYSNSNIKFAGKQSPAIKPENIQHKSKSQSIYDKFTGKMEEWQKPFYDGDGKLSLKEAVINQIRGVGSLVTEMLSKPKETLIITGSVLGAAAAAVGIGAAFVGVSAAACAVGGAIALGGAVIGGGVGLYHLGKAAYKFATAKGDEKQLAEANLNTGKALAEVPLAAFSGKMALYKFRAFQNAKKAAQLKLPPVRQNVPELQGKITNGEVSARTGQSAQEMLHRSIYMSDPDTAEHTHRVANDLPKFLRIMGFKEGSPISKEACIGAELHDDGKILNKTILKLIKAARKLTSQERTILRDHASLGADKFAKSKLFGKLTENIARYHHTSYDDLLKVGLPDELLELVKTNKKLSPEEIRIIQATAFADIKDAMTAGRPYLRKRSIASALPDIEKEAAKIVNHEWLPAFMDLITPRQWGKTLFTMPIFGKKATEENNVY